MKPSLKKTICVFVLLISICDSGIDAQILGDSAAISLIKAGIDKVYNFQFGEADEIYSEIKRLYDDHPVNYLFHGIMVYWQNYPMLSSSASRNIFEEDLRKCIRICEKKTYSKDHEAEAVLGNLCARGLLLLFYTDNDMSANVISVSTGTYKYLMRAFDYNTIHSDLYYFTGLYNYYREAYPEIHPIYKPVAALFPPGNMQTGLAELNISAKNGIIMSAESQSILSWIYTFYENDSRKALNYTGNLYRLYPFNLFFKSLYIKNLLLLKNYDEAENYLEMSPEESQNAYYCAQVRVFSGIIQEKKYQNNEMAYKLYEEGFNMLDQFKDYGKEFSAYALFGMSRINELAGNKADARKQRRKAMDLASFKDVNFD